MNKLQLLKIISITSLLLLGFIFILKIWSSFNWYGIDVQLIETLAVIFLVTTLIHELLKKDLKK